MEVIPAWLRPASNLPNTGSNQTSNDSQGEEEEKFESVAPISTMSSCQEGERGAKKHKYAFQTRSHVDVLDDGYRWRKYGQKAVKNSKFPRCTEQGCNVKKQVQRLSKDEGVVVTTYEGVHSHPIQKPNDSFEHILMQMQMQMQIYAHLH